MRELILVNQLESNVEMHSNGCKSKSAQFYDYGFYLSNRIYTVDAKVCLHPGFSKVHFLKWQLAPQRVIYLYKVAADTSKFIDCKKGVFSSSLNLIY